MFFMCVFELKHCQQPSKKVTDALEVQSKPVEISSFVLLVMFLFNVQCTDFFVVLHAVVFL